MRKRSVISEIPYDVEMMSEQVRKYYNLNLYNETYRRQDNMTEFERDCIDYFLNLLGNSPKLLDLGCGAARPYDSYLVAYGCDLTGIDFSEKQIRYARRNCPQGHFLCMDILNYDFEDQYDGIVMFYSLFHIHRNYHKILLHRIYNGLRDYGTVLMNIRKEDSGEIKYKSDFCGFPMYWSHYGESQFLQLVKDVGFSVSVLGDEKDYGSKESHVWVVMKKGSSLKVGDRH